MSFRYFFKTGRRAVATVRTVALVVSISVAPLVALYVLHPGLSQGADGHVGVALPDIGTRFILHSTALLPSEVVAATGQKFVIVYSPHGAARNMIVAAPPLSGWSVVSGRLSWDLPSSGNFHRVIDAIGPSGGVSATYRISDRGGTEAVQIELGPNRIRAGNLGEKLWGPVGVCGYSADAASEAGLVRAFIRSSGGPSGGRYVVLAAFNGAAACESSPLSGSGPMLLSWYARTGLGSAPELCVWQPTVGACVAGVPQPVQGKGWRQYRAVITPLPGSFVVIYARSTTGQRTIDLYANVICRSLPVSVPPVYEILYMGKELSLYLANR